MPAEIKVPHALQDTINRLRLQSPAALERALDGKLIPIVAAAKRNWPKKTGNSARVLRLRVELENNRIVRYVQNLVPYSGATEFKGTDINVAEALVFEPIAAALQPMLEAFARELAKAG
jgi:hypothetical protein